KVELIRLLPFEIGVAVAVGGHTALRYVAPRIGASRAGVERDQRLVGRNAGVTLPSPTRPHLEIGIDLVRRRQAGEQRPLVPCRKARRSVVPQDPGDEVLVLVTEVHAGEE